MQLILWLDDSGNSSGVYKSKKYEVYDKMISGIEKIQIWIKESP